MLVALGVGATVFLRPKGTRTHKNIGRIFVVVMLISNAIVFAIQEDTKGFGVFHAFSVVSCLSIVAGATLARLGRRVSHAHVMLWSFGGVCAAGAGQGAVMLNLPPWPFIILTFLLVGLVAFRANFVLPKPRGQR
ncbi:hypothetical protein ACMU_10915 [Actibacterium mucosum KCTC 23349]|uniref:DUF2306 domain-containing protein n=2 Tax=Actibacterium TaxID=1433986 RepID=A0A037ZIH6_9RHOB|nr:hypothetical protein ACMU_10915 [Actibacterium mucosum KCTC 23349]